MQSNDSEFYTSEEGSENTAIKFNKLIDNEEKSINKELFKDHFKFESLIDMLKEVSKTKNTNKDKELVKDNIIKIIQDNIIKIIQN